MVTHNDSSQAQIDSLASSQHTTTRAVLVAALATSIVRVALFETINQETTPS
jgi:hypothetical protein